MRAFIILTFLVAASQADVSHLVGQGYNYGQKLGSASVLSPSIVSGGGLISSGLVGGSKTIVTGGNLLGGGLVNNGGLIGSGLVGGQVLGGSSIVGGQVLGGSSLVGGQVLGGSSLVGGQVLGGGSIIGGGIVGGSGSVIRPGTTTVVGIDAVDSVPPTVEYSKQVFYFSAPEEEQQSGVVQQQLSNILKKNLQVVFIKAPENAAATNAALQLAKQAIEQRTAIYVLSKENDANQIVGQLQQIQENVPTVPEVRIVKYRTPEDLAYATQIIKDQYNGIGGPSDIINGGVAPVLNYASKQAGTVNVIGSGSGIVGGVSGISTVGNVGNVGLVGGLNKIVGGGSIIDASGLGGVQVVGGVNKIVSGTKYSSGSYLPPNLKK